MVTRRALFVLALVAGLIGAAAPAVAHSTRDQRPGITQFNLEVRATSQLGGAGSPAVAEDSYGNIYVVGTTGEAPLPVSPALNDGLPVRAAPWLRASFDDSRTFQDVSLAAGVESLQPGGTPDVAADDAGGVYVLSALPGRTLVSRFAATGKGTVALASTVPLPGAAGAGGRSWIAAQGAGRLYVLDHLLPATAPGDHYAVRMSTDGGLTFSTPVLLAGSAACRGAADRRKGSTFYAVACTDGAGAVNLYTTTNGATFTKTKVGSYNAKDVTASHPAVAVGRDGTVYVLVVDAVAVDESGMPTSNRLVLYRSKDGVRWSLSDLTQRKGRYRYGALAAAPNGRIGVSVYAFEAAPRPRWYIEAAVFSPGQKPYLVNFADHTTVTDDNAEPPGDTITVSFGTDSLLNVVWLHPGDHVDEIDRTVNHELWFVQTLRR